MFCPQNAPALGRFEYSTQVYATHSYGVDSIALDMRYAEAISSNHDNHSVADMRKISDMTPDTP